MKWEMEMEEIEAVLEKIWDLHDRLSDAIHSISRSQFLTSLKTLKKPDDFPKKKPLPPNDDHAGFVFIKDFRIDDGRAIEEARSLNAIRTALENLEDQLDFFHTVQSHQQAERDAAIARLEQSRIILAMRLADHRGKKYKVLEEALAFVGDVHDAGRFVSPEHLFDIPRSQSGDNMENPEKRSHVLMQVFISSFNFAKKSLKIDLMGGVIGNAALIAVSMLALFQLHHVAFKNDFVPKGNEKNNVSKWESASQSGYVKQLNVLSGRG